MTSLSEKSTRSAVACILTTYSKLPDASVAFQMVQDFKLAFGTMAGHQCAGLNCMLQYPAMPSDLPESHHQKAYPGQGPANHVPETYVHILPLVPLRKSSKLVAQKVPAEHQAAPVHQPASGNDVMQNMATMFMQALMGSNPFGQNEGHHQKLQVPAWQFKPRNMLAAEAATAPAGQPQKPEQPALPTIADGDAKGDEENAKGDEEMGDPSKPDPEAPKPSIEAIEEATFNALMAKKGQKNASKSSKPKPDAKAKSKAKAKCKAGTMAKAKCKSKAKAAAQKAKSTFSYDCGMPNDLWKNRTRESWTSKHYHPCRKLARDAGFPDDDCLELARAAHKKAAAAWDAC